MAIDFKINDFCYPVSILKTRNFLEKSQWFSPQQLEAYQLGKLRALVTHAYEEVPYYKDLFQRHGLRPENINTLEDLKKLPLLTKDILSACFSQLSARNLRKYKPVLYRTSGISGEPAKFYLDKSLRVFEFNYYWRHWSWAGYKLGDSFAEIRPHYFFERKELSNRFSLYQRLMKRLLLNGLLFSPDTIGIFIQEIKKHRPFFLRGSASSLYVLALFLLNKPNHGISFRGVFSTGEMLLDYQRKTIEKVFQCKVLDSYGNMEGTVKISQCLEGGLHINSEYGILELEEKPELNSCLSGKNAVAKAIGTSLHNFAMPFLRYSIGDFIEVESENRICKCGRGLPLIKAIHGRCEDAVITPDNMYLTSLFTVFNLVEGIVIGQIIQEQINTLLIKINKSSEYDLRSEEKLISLLRACVGKEMKINIEYLPLEKIRDDPDRKFKFVISTLPETRKF
ncbi:MAG: hypothetical protein PHY94_07315 [Candidatus Omnitrophica bacterium]|nr:hypothetical protein [Candidatus Omnitrophota bacterium]